MSITTHHPRAYATVTGPTATFVSPGGRREPVTATGDEDIRQAVLRRAADEARRTGSPVELVTSGDRGDHHLLVGADGELAPITTHPQATDADHVEGRVDTAPARVGEEVREQAQQPNTVDHPSGPAAEPPPRPTFIGPASAATTDLTGWRAILHSLGIRVAPSAAARMRDDCTALVSRQWAGCRTIAVANGKGGVGKTMTTAMLAAVYARHGGGNVLAWDNNDTRGTLGWRTEQGLYDTTIRDLLPATPHLLAPTAGVADITQFVHHQPADRYDVLRSNPELLATDQRIAAAQFDQLMQVAARYYRLVIFDSGNDESAERWLRMIDSSYQLVVPTLAAPESAESAALLAGRTPQARRTLGAAGGQRRGGRDGVRAIRSSSGAPHRGRLRRPSPRRRSHPVRPRPKSGPAPLRRPATRHPGRMVEGVGLRRRSPLGLRR